jgi:small multidrug resistance family-3 protein
MPTAALFALAAVLEIAGCFAVWMWWRLDRSILWLAPGFLALAAFAFLLAQADTAFAGRAYAAYGGVYVAASLAWLWAVEGQRPDAFDLGGAVIVLLGAGVILYGRRLVS